MKLNTKPILALSLVAGLLAACVSHPIAVIGENGGKLKGQANATLDQGGYFQAFGENGLSCQGRFNPYSSDTVSFPVKCSNGLTGIGTATYESPTRGHGSIRMGDGSDWRFIFGPEALEI